MSPIELILSRLDRPREVARGRWRARCPGHAGMNTTTLAITEGDDGRVLINCHAGCEVDAVVGAIGLELKNLFPPRPAQPGGGASPMRQPFIPTQVFEVAQREILVAWVIANDMRVNQTVDKEAIDRLTVAAQRLDDIGRAAYGRS
jgi:hypothetical protein